MNADPPTDHVWMSLALEAARQAAASGEVPVGAVLVRRSSETAVELLACNHNQPIGQHDPTAHAEMLVLREAAQRLGNYRLDDCELYVTLEPCAMCAQAMLHARIKRVVFGAREPKTGAAGSVLDVFALPQLNHHTQVEGGVLAEECGALLSAFFQRRRAEAKRASVPLREDALRTPDAAFAPVWTTWPQWQPCSHYTQAPEALGQLRLHWMDLGPDAGQVPWVGLHGPAGWWPQCADWAQGQVAAGERVLLPDLIGFGQSDKPKKPQWHSLERHAQVLWAWLDSLGLASIRLAVAPGQAPLARVMRQQQPGRVQQVLNLTTASMGAWPPAWGDAPYPDAGHRAAHTAWQTGAWNRDSVAGQ